MSLELSDSTRARLAELGADGARWLEQLPDTVDRLCERWDLTVEASFLTGSASLVLGTVDGDGVPSVLKLFIPAGGSGYGAYEDELTILELGRSGHVRLLGADTAARAMWLERLGDPLGAGSLPVPERIDIIGATLAASWGSPPDDVHLRTGAEQAQGLIDFIDEHVSGSTLEHDVAEGARELARRRRDAFDTSTAVLVHGDGHEMNVLAVPGEPGEYRLIDPEPMCSTPEHDLALPLRDWSDHVLQGDAVATGRAWCRRIAAPTRADAQAIWEWACVERVTTGLLLERLGNPESVPMLEVARRWIRSGVGEL